MVIPNLLLARSAAREREIAVRAALGAGRVRLVRQMLTECIVIAVMGGALGVVFAIWGVDALAAFSAGKLPRMQMVGVDARMFGFTLAATVLTGLMFGLVPAFQLSKATLHESLKEGGRGSTTGMRQNRLRGALVIAELALAVVLLTGAGLLMRTFLNLERVAPGFNPSNVITMGLDLPRARYPDDKLKARFYQRLLERIQTQPGVRAAGITSDLPWTGYDENTGFDIPGRSSAENAENHARYHFISPDYFRSIGVPLIAGRYFTERDNADAPLVILVNQSMARRFWPKDDATGKPLDLWGKHVKIAGIVGDVKDSPATAGAEPAFYWPIAQNIFGEMYLTVRADSNPSALVGAVRRELAALDKDLPISDIRTLEDICATAVSGPRLALMLVGIFAGLALVLATIGIYGVTSYLVSQRVHEIGVRMALGAQWSDVLRLVVGHGLKLALAGVAAGLVAALSLRPMMSSLLYGVTATDPATLAGVALVLVAVAAVACYVPARRASRVDPMIALRYE